MFALSVSISTSGGPRFPSPPSGTSHLSTVPSSIESDRRGMRTSEANGSSVLEGGERGVHHVLLVRERRLLERLGVRHRHVPPSDPPPRRVEVVERLLLYQRGKVRADPAVGPALFDDHRAIGLSDRLENRVQVERAK